MAEDDGQAPKRPKSIDLAKLVGDDTATGRLRKQIKAMEALEDPAGFSALRAALGPTSAIQEMMESHRAAIDTARILPDMSDFAGIAAASRLADSYRLPKLARLGLMDAYKLPEIAGIGAVSDAHLRIMDSFRAGSLVDMIGSQGALAALAPSLGLVKTDAFAGLMEGVRSRQSALSSAIAAYMDQQREQVERIPGLMEALAMPRIDPARFGIASALALGETDAFRIAGLTPDYVDQYRSILSAANERINAFAGLSAAANTFALQPDLVGGIGSLLERALAQQEALLEQQRQQGEQTANAQPKTPSRLVQQLYMLAAIVAILQFFIFIALQIEERMLGGDTATLNNTAAIEENTQAIEQMRNSFDVLAGQIERMRVVQEEAAEEERAADAAIAEILREIADTLADQAEGEGETP
ncbi:hypothetical protein [Roseinatronobacter alkalisoli]|uniref:Uncharacterized protein n=1 Tax=Roseinatronobacter alkalisoli TaxID=3028235 RepID=A0ABT5TFK9_9RHOB|nr:hypothetical protein [Roseinatronobacter sp. HJB301]MDD7973918.1 hypothetical protein [Roseinatronobacter sp. HJB301]